MPTFGGSCLHGRLKPAPQRQRENDCGSCDVGYMLYNATEERCIPCPMGHFSDDGGNCQACPAGYYTSAVASTGCSPCEANRYTDAPGQAVCKPCAAGSDT